MNTITRRICTDAMGIALFVALSICLQVPVFENYYLCLGYVAMAVYCFSFGAVDGMIVGSLGVVLYCLVINGLRGMPGWTLGNLVIGLLLGLTFGATRNIKGTAIRLGLNALAVVLSVTIGILVVKSAAESALYMQPFLVRVGKNFYAWVADIFVLLVSLPICESMDKSARKLLPEREKRQAAR